MIKLSTEISKIQILPFRAILNYQIIKMVKFVVNTLFYTILKILISYFLTCIHVQLYKITYAI